MDSLSGIFPSNVIVEILACLPARPLVRCRCVSKSWRSLLSEPYFVTKWLNRGGTSLLVVPLEWENRDKCSLVFESVSIGKENLTLPLRNRLFSLSVVGSSGDSALICLTGLSYVRRSASKLAVILWNPFTGEVKALGNEGFIYCHHRPLCSESLIQGYSSGCCNQYHVHGFGYEPNARDYKVVRITYSRGIARPGDSLIRPWHVEVYSLRKDTWTSLGRTFFKRMIRGNSRAFVNGSVHWLTSPTEDAPYDSIVAFGMEEESFGEVIELPRLESLSQFSLNPRGKATLSVSCGSLALIAFGIWNREECGIWVMKEYGVAESWTKQHHIVLPIGSTVRGALGLTGHGKILLRMIDEKLVCCDVEDMQISEIGIQGGSPESSFDVIDLGGGDPTLRNQAGRGSPLTVLNLQ
ncbi:F-box protein At3g07870-like [Syzygium oleosum]|uniref:F-box protein At3g07870-like n=1 Tax=Syzygium oleosum TaxID=219896 RepID=UPI0011D1846E|nr:F-box protein At3g07870-like [Syzygium oleosum]